MQEDSTAKVLSNAARSANFEACKALFSTDRFSTELNKIGPLGTNPLHLAVWRNHLELVETLLKAGASPDIPDKESGWTCLHKALYYGNIRIAVALIAAGANLFQPDWLGRTPLDILSQQLKHCLPSHGPGDVYSWGNGSNYTLGVATSTAIQTSPLRVDTLHGCDVVSLSAAKFHSCALTEDGRLYTWGWAHGGRLGLGQIHTGESAVITPRLVTGLGKRRVVAVAAAKHHTVLCIESGDVYTMGSNRHGQLGYPAVDTQPVPRRVSSLRARIVTVAAANKHSVAVGASGDLYTWGSNALGQLGYGTFDSGSNTTPRLVEALKDRRITHAAAAKRHTVVLTAEGDVFQWGHRGVSPRRVQLSSTRDTTTKDGKPLTFHKGHAEVVKPVAIAICAGAAHTSVLTKGTGTVLTWRSADPALIVQEVGGALAGKIVVALSAGKYRTAAVTDEGDVYAWEGRSDFFPADGRHSGSGSKKSGAVGGGGSAGKIGRGIPIARLPATGTSLTSPGSSFSGLHNSLLRNNGLIGGSYDSGCGSYESNSGRGSFLERVYALKQQQQSGNTTNTTVNTTAVGSPRVHGKQGTGYSNTTAIKAGSSPSMTGKSYTPSTSTATTAATTIAVDEFKKILPERVPNLKRIGTVAVGEKHSLALQRWFIAQSSSSSSADSSSNDDENNDDVESLLHDNDNDDDDEHHHNNKDNNTNASSSTVYGPPTLQHLAETAVSRQLVDPRTALQVLEYADIAGAAVLREYCLAIAACNLDAVLIEALGALEELPLGLLSALERRVKTQLGMISSSGGIGELDSSSNTTTSTTTINTTTTTTQYTATTRGGGRPSTPLLQLHDGTRPTAAPPTLGDLTDDDTTIITDHHHNGYHSHSDNATFSSPLKSLSPSTSSFQLRQYSSSVLSPAKNSLQRESSFKDEMTASMEEAYTRLRRSLAKKLQQIDQLEAKAASGAVLDPQQRAKIAQKQMFSSSLTALEGGMPLEDVKALLRAATQDDDRGSSGGGGSSSVARSAKGKAKDEFLITTTTTDEKNSTSSSSNHAKKSKSRSRSKRQQSESSVLSAEFSSVTLGSSPATGTSPPVSRGLSPLFNQELSSSVATPSSSSSHKRMQSPFMNNNSNSNTNGSDGIPMTHIVGFATPSSSTPTTTTKTIGGVHTAPMRTTMMSSQSSSSPHHSNNNNTNHHHQQHHSSWKASSSEKPPRKGALSMFLRGELDKPPSSQSPSSRPAWGTVAVNAQSNSVPSPSLKEILHAEAKERTGASSVVSVTTPTAHNRPTTPVNNNNSNSGNTNTRGGDGTTTTTNTAMKIPLSHFLSPGSNTHNNTANKSPAWGGVAGVSPPLHQPSLREIQQDQERKRQEIYSWGTASPRHSSIATASSSLSSASLHVNGGGGGSVHRPPLHGGSSSSSSSHSGSLQFKHTTSIHNTSSSVLGTSPSTGSSLILGTSPSGRVFFSAPPPMQSKWFVPEDQEHEQRRKKSLAAIQKEESAMQELAKRYGDGNVKIVKKSSSMKRG